ncbi:MAG: glucosamine kinase [Pseudomonadota bacterium]
MLAPTSPTCPARPLPRYLIGVDGGGSGTRARVQTLHGQPVGEGSAGPSGLSQGIEQAWRHIGLAVTAAFADAGLSLPSPADCALSLALAGAERSSNRDAFLASDPGHALCLLENDALGALRGAFSGRPGRVVAAGTGSVGAARWPDGTVRLLGGWGFPIGDEGSGAWLGVRAVQHAQAAMDGRAPSGPLALAVWSHCGNTPPRLLDWSLGSGQRAYAQLAPLVFELAEQDPQAERLLQGAAHELSLLAQALQPAGPSLPLVVYGSIGCRLASRLPATLRQHVVTADGDAMAGALLRLQTALDEAAVPCR